MASKVYYLIDGYGTEAGVTGSQGSGGSGEMLSPEFTAAADADAVKVAHIFATCFQRPVRLVIKGGSPPWTLVSGVGPTLAITAVPSGVGY